MPRNERRSQFVNVYRKIASARGSRKMSPSDMAISY